MIFTNRLFLVGCCAAGMAVACAPAPTPGLATLTVEPVRAVPTTAPPPTVTRAPAPTNSPSPARSPSRYPLHANITATIFWVGEAASPDNAFIDNIASAWDDKWMEHFGGADNPEQRKGFFPAEFTPRENPFYLALPYDDFDNQGTRRTDAFQVVYWAKEKNWGASESMLKNRWVKIAGGDRTVYAQWEDVGPFETGDAEYVFGSAAPRNRENNRAGIDVSPAVRDDLGLIDDITNVVSWQFVDAADVPEGPWKQIITTR